MLGWGGSDPRLQSPTWAWISSGSHHLCSLHLGGKSTCRTLRRREGRGQETELTTPHLLKARNYPVREAASCDPQTSTSPSGLLALLFWCFGEDFGGHAASPSCPWKVDGMSQVGWKGLIELPSPCQGSSATRHPPCMLPCGAGPMSCHGAVREASALSLAGKWNHRPTSVESSYLWQCWALGIGGELAGGTMEAVWFPGVIISVGCWRGEPREAQRAVTCPWGHTLVRLEVREWILSELRISML